MQPDVMGIPMKHHVCIALGSNMGDRHAHLQAAVDALARIPSTCLEAMSEILETSPVGPIDQGAYLNAAAVLSTSLNPQQLLAQLNLIEAQQGRDSLQTRIKWGPRPLDLDILLFDQLICDVPGLVIPHPLMHERWFVLKPLSQIASDWVHPKLGQTVSQMLAHVNP